MTDLEVVTWVQNKSTKEVLQAAAATSGTVKTFNRANASSIIRNVSSNVQANAIVISNALNSEIRIIDISGKQLLNVKCNEEIYTFDTRKLPIGCYTVHVRDHIGVVSNELVVVP